MKKQKRKALEQLAIVLPDVYISRNHTSYDSLANYYKMMDDGIKIEGLPELSNENADKSFGVKFDNFDKINHVKRLKRAYKSKGTTGIQEYVLWCQQHNLRFAKKHFQVKQVNPKILDIAKSKVSSFWKSLIIFLYSFFITFQKEDND